MCDLLGVMSPICLAFCDSCFSFQVLELIRNPDMIEEMMHHGDRALDNLQPEQGNPETTGDSDSGFQNTDTKRLKLSQVQVWK